MCNVEVGAAWRNRLPPRSEEEEQKLDELPLVTPGTRLACHILWRDELDGLEVRLPPRDDKCVGEIPLTRFHASPISESLIPSLVEHFYMRGREDEVLGPIFEPVLAAQWEHHIAPE
jgi:hypothetical protein